MSRLITVVMPAHNSSRFVEDAINSVLTQTHSELELIVIDDGSTDKSREIIKKFADMDDRIKLLIRDEPSGSPAIPRNMGLDMSRGRYVAFLDSDDIWCTEKLEKQLEFMIKKNAVITYTGFQRINEVGVLLKKVQVPESMNYSDLLQNTAIATSSVMIDMDTIQGERFSQRGHEDYAFWLGIVRKYGCCFGLNQELLKYRVVKGSISSGKIKSAGWVWRVYRDCERLSIPYSMWCLANYGVRAMAKRLY